MPKSIKIDFVLFFSILPFSVLTSQSEIGSSTVLFRKSESSTRNSVVSRGIPARCACGGWARRFTSATTENPGRPFYRCETMTRQDHLFKWVEDALIEEIVDGKGRLGDVDCEINKLRSAVDKMSNDIYEFHNYVVELKWELKKFKLGFWVVVCVDVMYVSFM